MFRHCRCRIYIKKHNKVYSITSIHWENDKIASVKYIDSADPSFVRYHTVGDCDILCHSIGQFDKNGKEIWTGDIVKYDPSGHGNYILGLVDYDSETTSFVIKQLTDARDYFYTQEELDEQFIEYGEQYPENKIPRNQYQFESPTNWYSVMFYDHTGKIFNYSDLEVIGDIYTNSAFVSQNQKHFDFVEGKCP